MNVGVIAGAAVARMLERRIAKNFIHYQNEQQQRGQTMPTKKTNKLKNKAAGKKKTEAKKKTVKPAFKIQRKVITEKDVARVSYNVELSRGDMAVIVNALNWSNDSATFKLMPKAYKTKHKKVLFSFDEALDK